MHPTNGSPSSKSSSTTTASTLRPRTRRLISIDDELDPASSSKNGASPFGSRPASPNPSSLQWRPTVTSTPSSFMQSASAQTSKASRDVSVTLSGLWGNSWSAITGLATNVLSGETAQTNTAQTNTAQTNTAPRGRKPWSETHQRVSSNSAPTKWGPSASVSSQVGVGTQEERESLVRAMRRKDLLTANEYMISDSIGRFKRRNSDDRTSMSAPPGETEDRDALVYIHRVGPQDTLAGLTIKFNCQLAVLRKANRMWPNDSVQTKTTIVLPVDACGVKGRPVTGPDVHQEEDLLLGEYGDNTENTRTNFDNLPNGWGSTKNPTNFTLPVPSSSQSNADSESSWKHDSWVLLPNDTTPTEIGRIPRRALGFFPPARRKSLAFSEASTPRPSVDLSQASTSTSSDTKPSKSKPSRPRAPSNLSSVAGPQGRHRSNSTFLQGPGGVGTMKLNVRSPGPAQDGLNKLFAAHLPNVAPPPGQEYFTPWAPSLLDVEAGTHSQYSGGSGARTPLGGAAIDLQEIGGAIEGWVRKVGSQASKLLAEPSTATQGKRSGGTGMDAVSGDFGDLIELRDDAFEIGNDEADALRGKTGRREQSIPTSQQYQSARPDINLAIRDRGTRGNSRGDRASSKTD